MLQPLLGVVNRCGEASHGPVPLQERIRLSKPAAGAATRNAVSSCRQAVVGPDPDHARDRRADMPTITVRAVRGLLNR
jgi:hypothetical protein